MLKDKKFTNIMKNLAEEGNSINHRRVKKEWVRTNK